MSESCQFEEPSNVEIGVEYQMIFFSPSAEFLHFTVYYSAQSATDPAG